MLSRNVPVLTGTFCLTSSYSPVAYARRDSARAQRLRWWQGQLDALRVIDFTDDDVLHAVEDLAGGRPASTPVAM